MVLDVFASQTIPLNRITVLTPLVPATAVALMEIVRLANIVSISVVEGFA